MSRSLQQSAKALRVVTICLDAASLASMKHDLKLPENVEFVASFSQYIGSRDDGSLLDKLAELLPDVVVVDFDQNRQDAETTAGHLDDLREHDVAIFAASSKTEPALIISAMRSGCSEYLVKPLTQDSLTGAFAKIRTKKLERARTQQRGKVITLLGAKGGTGVTAIAVHLATFLSRLTNRSILLVDQHPDLGVSTLYLGIDKPPYHFYELVENVHRLDAKLVQGFVVHHPSGVDVLASPGAFNGAAETAPQNVEYTIDFLKTLYDYTLVDCAPGLNGLNVASIRESDEVWLIATPDVASVRNIARHLEHLARFNYPDYAIKIVINRHEKRGVITKEHFEKVLKKPVYVTLPNGYLEVMDALNSGTPMSPETRSEFAAGIRQWAEALIVQPAGGAAVAEEPKRAFGMLHI
ncbi:MAG: AAA family ATPase [Acidobacteriia bacterium]|nr:AAA family ATPase [Terriglobia bacterium]